MMRESTLGWIAKTSAVVALAFATAMPLGNLHPYFTVKHILPATLDEIAGIGGIDLFANGDGVICTWGGSQQPPGKSSKSNGEVWIIPTLASGTPGTPVRIATGLREPLGVKVVGNDFYVMEKPQISKFTGSGSTWTKSTLWSLPTTWYDDNQWHHFSFNLVLKDNAFWFTTGTAYDYNPADKIQRGALIRVPLTGGSFTQLARGLRNPDGLAIGPDSQFFATENQGHWKPTNSLYHVPVTNVPENGRFFGFRTTGNNSCGTTAPNTDGTSCPADPEYPPAVWLPYGTMSQSPTRPILLNAGPYAGQMLVGDVNKGGIYRYFVEKVGGEYQGAAFSFMTPGTGGINFGIHQFLYTPTGTLLAAGIGGGDACGVAGSGNWNWNSTCRGLDLLTPGTNAPFEILAVRSLANGFDIEFTQPASASAATPGNYVVRTTGFTPVQTYGIDGDANDNAKAVTVTTATLSEDKKHVKLVLGTMPTRKMYQITVNNVTDANGAAPYIKDAYYTLNKIGPSTTAIRSPAESGIRLHATVRAGDVSISIPFTDAYSLGLFALDGTRVGGISGKAPSVLRTGHLKSGIYLLSGTVKGAGYQARVKVF